jgi:ankyrin repeat protein
MLLEDIFLLLERSGANIHHNHEYPLRRAIECGHLNIVKYLIEKRSKGDAMYYYALRGSAINNHIDIIDYLITIGANYCSKELLPEDI